MLIFLLPFIPFSHTKEQIALATDVVNSLENRLNQFINNEQKLNGAIAGISIRSASTGKVIYEHFGDIRLKPASNMKLLTAATALSVLGKDYTFRTELLTDGVVVFTTLQGNLYLRGKGDPTLLKDDFDLLAKKIRQSGITTIQGNVIGEDSWYDHVRYSDGLTWSDESAYYGAQISALTASPDKDFDSGTVIIEVRPSEKIGRKATISVKPKTDYVKIINNAITVSKKGTKTIKIFREHGTNTIVVNGNIPIKASSVKEWVSVKEPTEYAVNLFEKSLKEHDIKLLGDVDVGITPTNATRLAVHESMTLAELMVPFMKLSNNGHAEVLVKEMGKVVKGEGSWDKGIEVMNAELPKFGVNPKTLVIKDGSGISHSDLIPANEISKLLYSVQTQDWFQTFANSLPIAGISDRMVGGTLRYRMKQAPLYGVLKAKTGTITNVSSLSGYIQTKQGNNLIFSIILNNMLDDANGKAIEDKICAIIAEY